MRLARKARVTAGSLRGTVFSSADMKHAFAGVHPAVRHGRRASLQVRWVNLHVHIDGSRDRSESTLRGVRISETSRIWQCVGRMVLAMMPAPKMSA